MSSIEPIVWDKDSLKIIDQTQLPEKLVFVDINTLDDAVQAIMQLKIRGAPALGLFSAISLLYLTKKLNPSNTEVAFEYLLNIADTLKRTRPTAINLFLGINLVLKTAYLHKNDSIEVFMEKLEHEVANFWRKEIESCRKIGEIGNELIPNNATILTHCNAGALATGKYGTALSPIYIAKEKGKQVHVIADETRPLLQGARLTAWELSQAGIPVTVICDNMAGHVMKEKKVDLIIVGADRVASNGDTANKIGTYSLAVLANYHKIPFYVALPTSTFDPEIQTGVDIPIETRDPSEIQCWGGKLITPQGVNIYNPAFDVTPHELITGFITEKGIIYQPFETNLRKKIFLSSMA